MLGRYLENIIDARAELEVRHYAYQVIKHYIKTER